MTHTNIVLLLEGKDYEQETLAKASRLAQGLGCDLTLLHLTHSSKVRRKSLSLSEEERSAQGTLDAKAIISELITTLLHPVDFEYRVILPSKGLRVYGGHAIPVTEEDGSVVWYGHTADVTDKKALLTAYHGRAESPESHEVLLRLATEVGLDGNRVQAVLSSDELADEVRTQELMYQRAGIRSVPAVVINDRHLISGGQPAEVFEQALRQIAAEAQA